MDEEGRSRLTIELPKREIGAEKKIFRQKMSLCPVSLGCGVERCRERSLDDMEVAFNLGIFWILRILASSKNMGGSGSSF